MSRTDYLSVVEYKELQNLILCDDIETLEPRVQPFVSLGQQWDSLPRGGGWVSYNLFLVAVGAPPPPPTRLKKRHDILRLFARAGCDVNAAGGRWRWNALQLALYEKQPLSTLQLLIDLGVNVNYVGDSCCRPPLQWALTGSTRPPYRQPAEALECARLLVAGGARTVFGGFDPPVSDLLAFFQNPDDRSAAEALLLRLNDDLLIRLIEQDGLYNLTSMLNRHKQLPLPLPHSFGSSSSSASNEMGVDRRIRCVCYALQRAHAFLTCTVRGCFFLGEYVSLEGGVEMLRRHHGPDFIARVQRTCNYGPDFIARVQSENVAQLDAFVIHLLDENVRAGDLAFFGSRLSPSGRRTFGRFLRTQRELFRAHTAAAQTAITQCVAKSCAGLQRINLDCNSPPGDGLYLLVAHSFFFSLLRAKWPTEFRFCTSTFFFCFLFLHLSVSGFQLHFYNLILINRKFTSLPTL